MKHTPAAGYALAVLVLAIFMMTPFAAASDAALDNTGSGPSGRKGTADNTTMKPIWWNTYGSNRTDIGSSVINNGTYLYVAGSTDGFGAQKHDAFVLKYDMDGNLLWNRTWGGSGDDYAFGICQWGDNIYLAGNTDSYGLNSMDVLVIAYTKNGTRLWNSTWGTTDKPESGRGITCDGTNLYVAGNEYNGGSLKMDVLIVKFYMSGKYKSYDTWDSATVDSSDSGDSIIAVGSYLYVSGYTDNQAFLMKRYKSGGKPDWVAIWGNPWFDEGMQVINNGSLFYMVGSTTVYPNNYDVFLLIINDAGTIVYNTNWNYSSTTIERASSITTDGKSLYIMGYIKSDIGAYSDLLLLKYSMNGTFLWSKTWGGNMDDHGYSITCAGNYLYILGDTKSYGEGYEDVVMMKTDLDGIGGVVPEMPQIILPAILAGVAAFVVLGGERVRKRKKRD
jgi:hypothetical protein